MLSRRQQWQRNGVLSRRRYAETRPRIVGISRLVHEFDLAQTADILLVHLAPASKPFGPQEFIEFIA